MPKKMQHSTDPKLAGKYTRIHDKPDLYESLWGTRGTKNSKVCKSIAIAKHPVQTWAQNLKEIVAKVGHTDDERRAVLELVSAIDELGDFSGTRVFDLDVPSDGMTFQAMIVRIGE